MEFIDEIVKSGFSEEKVDEIKQQIKLIKKKKTTKSHVEKLGRLYCELDELLFMNDYLCIQFDKKTDFDQANKGFYFNNIRFTRLYGTNGGVKNETIVYVSDKVGAELRKRIDNGRDVNKEIVPAKLESYKSLISSASVKVTEPDEMGVLVVRDFVHEIDAEVIRLKDHTDQPPSLEEVYTKVQVNASDGFGLISPEFAARWAADLGLDYIPSGFIVRNSFCKGTLFTFDFVLWAKQKAQTETVKDVWSQLQDISKVQIILTAGMLKLWSSYANIGHYRACCKENGYSYRVTKTTPKKLEQERNLNYQFIQSLHLNEADLDQLLMPTVDEIKDVMGRDWRKSILYLKGNHVGDKNIEMLTYDYAQALMIDPQMINDPFVKRKIREMIDQRINSAKIGELKVKGNYSILSGDPVALLEHMFQFKEVRGLLGAGEFYSRYWLDQGIHQVAAFRAPMTCHNNIRIFRFVENEEINKWYTYLSGVTIINAWDTTTQALNGCDFDGDQIMTTSNEIILSGINESKALICEQKNANAVIPAEQDFVIANKNSFGNEIGQITNSATSMYDKLAEFKPESLEYKTLLERIMSCQHYQQNAIDKAKGIEFHPMPSVWFNYKSNLELDKDTKEVLNVNEFNIRILANKKPYFMIYRYEHLNNDYKKFLSNTNQNSFNRFGCSVAELIEKESKTDEETQFIQSYFNQMPVSRGNSVVNQLCWKIEEHFAARKSKQKSEAFDYSILMSPDRTYSKSTFKKIKDLYDEYKYMTQAYMLGKKVTISNRAAEDTYSDQRRLFTERFKVIASQMCSNEEELCDIIVTLCYTNDQSKQFAWDIVGEKMINNLLKRNDFVISYPELDAAGDIEFSGNRFSMKKKQIGLHEEWVHEYFAK
ncbi:hypothetical protein BC351_10240 [Paenibacillus ferrarius]|uniref:RNA dependent RNA polymerase n=1 Tax=Paenibacillus ferrarius TaxID=1469647 RepID=A0A1V4H941_9BACL|nr:hypothetical protein BC351_10240 [Paenibacillus ferrarius]